jgi:hypothetical protein
MKNLSYWALMNPWKSQTLLVICHFCLAVLAIYSGVWLFAHDISVPKPVFYLGEILFFTALILYPIRRARYKFWKPNFVRQKVMDVCFVLSYLLMAITITNTDANLAWNDTSDAPFVTQIAMRENLKPPVSAEIQAPTLSKKALRKQFKNFVTNAVQNARTGNSDGGSIAGVVLLMILGILLVTLLSCGLLCSNNTIGFILLFGGWIVVLALGISAIRQIKGKRKSNYQPTPTPLNEKI